MSERQATLVKSELPDWYTIEWADHPRQRWTEAREHPIKTLYHMWSGRLIPEADIEGTAAEMRAIADAIRNSTSISFRRCGVTTVCDTWNHLDHLYFLLLSPRNSDRHARLTSDQAQHLADEIYRVLSSSKDDAHA